MKVLVLTEQKNKLNDLVNFIILSFGCLDTNSAVLGDYKIDPD